MCNATILKTWGFAKNGCVLMVASKKRRKSTLYWKIIFNRWGNIYQRWYFQFPQHPCFVRQELPAIQETHFQDCFCLLEDVALGTRGDMWYLHDGAVCGLTRTSQGSGQVEWDSVIASSIFRPQFLRFFFVEIHEAVGISPHPVGHSWAVKKSHWGSCNKH